jgi:hypothetical protein
VITDSIAAVVLGGLLISAVTGNILMYRQVGELRVGVLHLAQALEALAATNVEARRVLRDDNAAIHLRIDDLVKRSCHGGSQ